MKRVRDVIAEKSLQHLVTTEPSATVTDAARLMAEWNVGALLVMENGQLVGLLSERDYVRGIACAGRQPESAAVRDIMTRNVRMVSDELTTEECMSLMTHFRTQESGIRPTDTVAFLNGSLLDGTPFIGMDMIEIVPGSSVASSAATVSALRHRLDVSNDGVISALDALLVINILNAPSAAAASQANPFADTNGDGLITAIDALLIFNYLSGPLAGQGDLAEGEGGVATNQSPADVKFYVVDAAAQQTFRYAADGAGRGSFSLNAASSQPTGIAANATGDTLWTIDGRTHQVTMQRTDGSFLGSWLAQGLRNP